MPLCCNVEPEIQVFDFLFISYHFSQQPNKTRTNYFISFFIKTKQNKIIQRLTEIKMRYFLKNFRRDKSWDSDSDLGLNRINNWKCLFVIFFFFQMIYLYETMKTDLRLVEKKIILLYIFFKIYFVFVVIKYVERYFQLR